MYNVRKIEENINMRGDFQGVFLYDELLAPRTTFKVGGSTPLLVEPCNISSFLLLIQAMNSLKIPYFILGGGSNIVVPDEGLLYPVVSTSKIDFISLSQDKKELYCGAGCSWKEIIDFCLLNQLGGLESFSGLPGSLGGAIFMNARCYDVSVSDVLSKVGYGKMIGESGGQQTVVLGEYFMNNTHWNYKVSPFQDKFANSPILSARLKVVPLQNDAMQAVRERSESLIKDRELKGHFSYPSAGSVFKNNRSFGHPSGKIIDEAGLRGLEIGGAQVAPWHGNFIINKGNATAKDIKKLVNTVQENVFGKTGYFLEPEIIFLAKNRLSY